MSDRPKSSPSPARIADHVSLFVLDDEGVFFDDHRQEIHRFNTAATFLWCCVESGMSPDLTAMSYAKAFDLSVKNAALQTRRTLGDWHAKGYLESGASGRARRRARRGLEKQTRHRFRAAEATPSLTQPGHVPSSRRAVLTLLDTRFQLLLEGPQHEAAVWPAFAHLESAAASDVDVTVEVRHDGQEHVVLRNGIERNRFSDTSELAPAVKAELWEIAVNRHAYFMEIHAGAVRNAESCLLLPAAAGSGKSSLTAALLREGFGYLTDESVLLQRDKLTVLALPLPLAIKGGVVDELARYYPELKALPVHRRADGVRVRYLVPPASAMAWCGSDPCTVTHLVFPFHDSGATTSMRRITRPDAIGRLLDQCLVLPDDLDSNGVRTLVEWMRELSCFELRFSSLEAAVASIKRQTALRGAASG